MRTCSGRLSALSATESFGFRGSFERGGYLSIDSLKEAFGGGEDVWSEAFRLDRRAKKTRLDYGRPGYLRALQGHSSDCGHELPYMAAPLDVSAVADLQRSHGKYIYHGTDIHVVEGIVARGLLPGGGPGGRLANHFVVGTMPTQWSDARGFRRGSNTVVQCDLEVLGRAGVRLFQGADGVLLADTVPPEAIFRILGADNKRGAYTEVLAEIGTDRMLHLVRDFRAEAVEAAAAAMDDSAAAAGSADVPGPAAPGEGAGADEADTEESSSGSDLPDTTAPAAAKAEGRSGAAEAARPERSAAGDDVDMGDVMSEAAASDPSLTIGELVDKTSEKLKFMAGYMEGAARMVRAEGLESARAGAEHRRVLEHAEDLLRRSEEFLEQQGVEAGAALLAPRPRGVRRLTEMRASSGTSMRSWAKPRPRPRTSPWRMHPRRRGRRRRNWFPTTQNPSTTGRTSLRAECPGSSKRPRTWRFPRVSWRP